MASWLAKASRKGAGNTSFIGRWREEEGPSNWAGLLVLGPGISGAATTSYGAEVDDDDDDEEEEEVVEDMSEWSGWWL